LRAKFRSGVENCGARIEALVWESGAGL